MSNLQKYFHFKLDFQKVDQYYHFKLDFQKVDQTTGGKWLIHGTKRRKDNQLLKVPMIVTTLMMKIMMK